MSLQPVSPAKILFLDSTPLSLLAQKPGHSQLADDCLQWFNDLQANGWEVYLPEMCDYEVRRELLRAGKTQSVMRLDALQIQATYLPITTDTMRRAADLWAQARNKGWATADPKAIDGDVILAAQAMTLDPQPTFLVVATENTAHLSRYVFAQDWRTITP